jgi:hypothetical protein
VLLKVPRDIVRTTQNALGHNRRLGGHEILECGRILNAVRNSTVYSEKGRLSILRSRGNFKQGYVLSVINPCRKHVPTTIMKLGRGVGYYVITVTGASGF